MLTAVGANAQSATAWPTQRIRAIVAIGPGSAVDIIGRQLFTPLADALGQPIIVENRTGAGGTLGAAVVAKADPDGYTVLVQSSTLALTPYLYANLSYDTAHDLVPVLPLATLPNVLVISPSKNIRTIKDFIAAARAKPGSVTYASPGVGTSTHIIMERFRDSAGFQAQHVPFRGAVEALTEVLAGRVDVYFVPLLLAVPQIKDGKLVPLVVSGSKRSVLLPDVPTIAEAGYPSATRDVWVAMFAPAHVPADILAKMRQESLKVINSPSFQRKIAGLGAERTDMTPAQFEKVFQQELEINKTVITQMGISATGKIMTAEQPPRIGENHMADRIRFTRRQLGPVPTQNSECRRNSRISLAFGVFE
jgi:tripartite-type tricarboxylate transporter receptor subunit TctC